MSDTRPDPAALLSLANREAASARRGRLKVFFGMAPGVGKTYAMLAATQRLAAQGHDVVIGIVETHGRTETEQQILGLDVLPRKRVEYRGATLDEFDLDAAIARRPELLVIDELAHTNAPGLRNEKRWQDVRACLDAGINVYSTLNVQHVESLNDVVAQIAGVRVRETVPDTVLEEADEIELVDVPPDALLDRLRAGKVYIPEQIAAAVDSAGGFFRRGNLAALRELALRRTAEWVDVQLQHERSRIGGAPGGAAGRVWAAADRILVCVGPSPSSRTLLRAAKRMAAGLRADMIAVFVDNPQRPLGPSDRERVGVTMKLAEDLGAEAVTIGAGTGGRARDAAGALLAFARDRNVSKVVVGKTARSRLAVLLLGSFMDEVIRRSGDINVYVIQGDDDAPQPGSAPPPPQTPPSGAAWARSLAIALAGVTAATAVGYPLKSSVAAANIAMLYLLMVAAVAYWGDRRSAAVSALLGVAAFDILFVPPFGSFAVSDTQYLITFAAMLTVGLSIAGLTARLRNAVETARERENRAAALYALSRELAAARDEPSVAAVTARHLHDGLRADAVVLGPGPDPSTLNTLAAAGTPDWLDTKERPVARWTIDHGKPAGAGTATLPASVARYVPVPAGVGDRAALGLRTQAPLNPAQVMLAEAVASLAGQALDRVRLIDSREQARVEAESERLRNALLSSVSHDLRTPLAGIAGAASTIKDAGETLDPATRALLIDSIVGESARLNELIANLVFATRLDAEGGGIDLRREWTTVEEIVGAGLAPHRDALAKRPFRVTGLADLPMLRVDNAMMPQVITNLIANALRHTPAGTPIAVSAWVDDDRVVVKVADEGPGVPSADSAKVFERFFRGKTARLTDAAPTTDQAGRGDGGLGLGLTICRGIVQAHGGRIWAEANHPRGAAFLFSLPIERPQPIMPAREAVA
jgi:two-component system sensor histidine kinase KdpD